MSFQGPSTPPPADQGTSTNQASPTQLHQPTPVKMAQGFAEHNRYEVQAFGYEGEIHRLKPFKTAEVFLRFLHVPEDRLESKLPSEAEFNVGNFLEAANSMSQSIKDKDFAESDLLVWKNTGEKPPRGHVTDTACKPDITVAFQNDFDSENTTLWPCIHLAGEQASRGKSRTAQEKQAISYLHYLLLARPDLYVAQGILTSTKNVMFLVGIGGVGIRSFTIDWTSEDFYKLMYAFIYRLYAPGDFADRSYKKMEPNHTENSVTYTVRIRTREDREEDCPGLVPIYASSPFETRTHVLSNPDSNFKLDGRVLTVLKDQFCRLGTRSNEPDILTRIHTPEKVPGVVEMVYHEMINLPHLKELGAQVGRGKTRIGMREVGKPFTSISTLQEMLETAFDLLEVLRFMRVKREVLHRDISKGNVMLINPGTRARTDNGKTPVGIKFVKYILGESDDPLETPVLLVDFNHAEDLSIPQSTERERAPRTGTPIFIARAVELGVAYPLPPHPFVLPAIPDIPALYASNNPDREERFPTEEEEKILRKPSADSSGRAWRHELEHDAESVFWLLLYWSMGAQPEGFPAEPLTASSWDLLLGKPRERHALLSSLTDASEGDTGGTIHSVYQPLLPLLGNLARNLRFDRFWLDENDKRNDLEYITEAFQRLIFEFLVAHQNEHFMICQVTGTLRQISETRRIHSLSWTTSQKTNSEKSQKRSSNEVEEDAETAEPERKRKRPHPRPNEMDDVDLNGVISEEADYRREDEE